MRTQSQQLPHIYRFLTAQVNFVLQRYASLSSERKLLLVSVTPVSVIILYLIFSIIYPISEFDQTKLSVLKNPKDAQAHLLLSRVFKKNNDLERATNEALVANLLAPENEEVKEEITQITDLKNKPQQLEKDFNYWEKILQEDHGYRDAFLQKAGLHYQLKNTSGAKVDLQKALELDPNYEPALKMQTLLEK